MLSYFSMMTSVAVLFDSYDGLGKLVQIMRYRTVTETNSSLLRIVADLSDKFILTGFAVRRARRLASGGIRAFIAGPPPS